MVTNLSNLTSAETVFEIVEYVNGVTDGSFASLFILAFFIVVTMIVSKKVASFEEAILIGSFAGFVISIFLVALELLNFYYIISFGVIMAFDAFWIYFKNK